MVIKKRLKADDIEKLENTSFAAVGAGAGGSLDRLGVAAESWSYCPSSDSCNCESNTCPPGASNTCDCGSATCCCGITACATGGLLGSENAN